MTLLIGVLCKGGVVIGADSAATMGSLGLHTVRQPVVKVSVVDGRALMATSGPVGLGQRLVGEFDEVLQQNKLPKGAKSHKAMQILRAAFHPYLAGELEAARIAAPVVGPQVAQSSAVSSTLLAMCLDDGVPRLFQFDQQGAPEEATDQLPFVSLGSGEVIADPFMAFLRGLFWDEGELPTLAEGQFATVWTLEQAIDVSPAFLSRPSRVFVLSASGGKCTALQLDGTEIQDDLQAVADAKQLLHDWRRVDRAVPPPPEP